MRIYHQIIILCVMLTGCDPVADCLKSAGEERTIKLEAVPFSAIEINTEFNVILQEGAVQQLTLTAGENLINDISYEVIDETFIISNNSSCRWVRSYDFPTLTITHPNIIEIRQGGSGLIKSNGVLHYPQLALFSKDQSGDFRLEVDCESLTISNNDVTNFYISGQSNTLKVNFQSGDGRFEGGDLRVQNAEVTHCGSNDIIIYATEELKGRLCAAGNLIYVKTTPATLDVTRESNGQLINQPE